MNEGVKRQHARIAAEKRIEEIEAGDRYSCAEKYELGACNGPDIDAAGMEPEDDKISLAGLLPKLPADSESGTFWPSEITGSRERDEAEIADALDDLPTAQDERFGPGMIETYTGDTYYFDNPDPTHIHLADIAHALSNHCRYAGHTKRFYSVGEHSLLVRNILRAQGYPTDIQICGLFHDGHEAYVMDAPSPLKPLLGDAFAQVAMKADVAISNWLRDHAYGLYMPHDFERSEVKLADKMALVYERKQLMKSNPKRWEDGYTGVPNLPMSMNEPRLGWLEPRRIESRFIAAANELGVSE